MEFIVVQKGVWLPSGETATSVRYDQHGNGPRERFLYEFGGHVAKHFHWTSWRVEEEKDMGGWESDWTLIGILHLTVEEFQPVWTFRYSFSGNIGLLDIKNFLTTFDTSTCNKSIYYFLLKEDFDAKKNKQMDIIHLFEQTKEFFHRSHPGVVSGPSPTPSYRAAFPKSWTWFVQFKVRPDELPENQIRPEVKMTLGLLGGSRFDG